MVVNLEVISLKCFVKRKNTNIIFHPKLTNKIELWKEKITLQEMAKIMLNKFNIPKCFLVKAINTFYLLCFKLCYFETKIKKDYL